MKALVLESNGVLSYKNIQKPQMTDEQCLIRVKAAGICDSDICRAYDTGAYFYPLVMGHEFAGCVEIVGKKVTRFKENDRVAVFPLIPCKRCEFCAKQQYAQCLQYDYYGSRRHGGFSEYVAVNEWNLIKIDDAISFEEASLLEPIAVALHAFKKTDAFWHSKAVVIGGGVIGVVIAHCLSGKLGKENVYIIDRNESKLSFVYESFGVEGFCDFNGRVKNLSGFFDLVVVACGAAEVFKESIAIAKNHGMVLWVGNIIDNLLFEKKCISSILRKELYIQGSWNSEFVHKEADDWHDALAYLKNSLFIKKLITHVIPLDEGAGFFNLLFCKKNGSKDVFDRMYGKAVFAI